MLPTQTARNPNKQALLPTLPVTSPRCVREKKIPPSLLPPVQPRSAAPASVSSCLPVSRHRTSQLPQQRRPCSRLSPFNFQGCPHPCQPGGAAAWQPSNVDVATPGNLQKPHNPSVNRPLSTWQHSFSPSAEEAKYLAPDLALALPPARSQLIAGTSHHHSTIPSFHSYTHSLIR